MNLMEILFGEKNAGKAMFYIAKQQMSNIIVYVKKSKFNSEIDRLEWNLN